MIASTAGSGLRGRGPRTVVALPGLLPVAPGRRDRVRDRRHLAERPADAHADVQPGQVGHRERPHRKPKSVSARSTSCGLAPSSSSRSAASVRRASMRLPTKPKQLPTTTLTLPSRLPTSDAVAITSGLVCLPRTISSSRITFAGLKKCMPSTSPGRLRRARRSRRCRDSSCWWPAPRRAWRRGRACRTPPS